MIREFSVENFLSIRDRQTISFLAKKPVEKLTVTTSDNVHISKLAVFFGPNASGKSNLLYAIQAVFRLMVTPRYNRSQKVVCATPFALTKDKPIKLEVSIYEDERYDYAIEYTPECILSESLYYYPRGSKALFYERRFQDLGTEADIKFGASLKLSQQTQGILISNTLNNHTVLSTFAKASLKEDAQPIHKLFGRIMKNVHDVDGDDTKSVSDILKELMVKKEKYDFYLDLLKKADINITGICIDDNKTSRTDSDPKYLFESKCVDGTFTLPLSNQSLGTLGYIKDLQFLYDMVNGDHVYPIDELDENLHFDLLSFYISYFITNTQNSQLIFTSQELQLLNEDIFDSNRFMVWFVDRDIVTASSTYNRADTYGMTKDQSLYKMYLNGALGAKPTTGMPF